MMTGSIPGELIQALPKGSLPLDWNGGLGAAAASLWDKAGEVWSDLVRQSFGGVAEILLVLVLAGLAETVLLSAGGGKQFRFVELAAACAVLLITVSDVDQLMGLGEETITKLEQCSKVLLPALAAATASIGYVSAAAVRQMGTVLVCDVLLTLLRGLILPLIWLHLSAAAAGVMLSDSRLRQLGQWIKKGVIWLLGGLLTLFSLYLGIAGAVAGSADGAAVRTVKQAVAGAVPMVGGLLSAAAETVLAGAGMLKNTVGLFGVLAVCAVCLVPFLRLGLQYLIFKLTALLASTLAPSSLAGLIDTLAGVFALVLAAAGSCAAVLLVSVISSLLVVIP